MASPRPRPASARVEPRSGRDRAERPQAGLTAAVLQLAGLAVRGAANDALGAHVQAAAVPAGADSRQPPRSRPAALLHPVCARASAFAGQPGLPRRARSNSALPRVAGSRAERCYTRRACRRCRLEPACRACSAATRGEVSCRPATRCQTVCSSTAQVAASSPGLAACSADLAL